jgi:hypothetical protein
MKSLVYSVRCGLSAGCDSMRTQFPAPELGELLDLLVKENDALQARVAALESAKGDS